MTADSFTFGTTNSMDAFGIKVISYDPFSPSKRPRNEVIDFRHGTFDQGRKFYNDRSVTVECHAIEPLSRAQLREVAALYSSPNILRFWDEPDKFYRGELMESVDVIVHALRNRHKFVLPFHCEPFAFGRQVTQQIRQGDNAIQYSGTIEAPTMLVIRNPNNFPINGISVRAVKTRR